MSEPIQFTSKLKGSFAVVRLLNRFPKNPFVFDFLDCSIACKTTYSVCRECDKKRDTTIG